MGPNFDWFNPPDPSQKPVIVDILILASPRLVPRNLRQSSRFNTPQNKARLLKMYCFDIA